jgi:hypothetical protein
MFVACMPPEPDGWALVLPPLPLPLDVDPVMPPLPLPGAEAPFIGAAFCMPPCASSSPDLLLHAHTQHAASATCVTSHDRAFMQINVEAAMIRSAPSIG